MKFLNAKKSVEIFFLALGLFLLFISLSLLGKPPVNQGVQAMDNSGYHQTSAVPAR